MTSAALEAAGSAVGLATALGYAPAALDPDKGGPGRAIYRAAELLYSRHALGLKWSQGTLRVAETSARKTADEIAAAVAAAAEHAAAFASRRKKNRGRSRSVVGGKVAREAAAANSAAASALALGPGRAGRVDGVAGPADGPRGITKGYSSDGVNAPAPSKKKGRRRILAVPRRREDPDSALRKPPMAASGVAPSGAPVAHAAPVVPGMEGATAARIQQGGATKGVVGSEKRGAERVEAVAVVKPTMWSKQEGDELDGAVKEEDGEEAWTWMPTSPPSTKKDKGMGKEKEAGAGGAGGGTRGAALPSDVRQLSR